MQLLQLRSRGPERGCSSSRRRPCRSRLWRCRARRTLGGRGRPRDVTTAGGTYVAVEGTTACDPCLLGHHCAAGASVALPCEAGSYSAGLDLASQAGAARALRARRARRLVPHAGLRRGADAGGPRGGARRGVGIRGRGVCSAGGGAGGGVYLIVVLTHSPAAAFRGRGGLPGRLAIGVLSLL